MRMEYFAHGTEPAKSCDCHVKYLICEKSEKLATEDCPKGDTQERVYLMKEEDTYTDDSRYLLTKEMAGSRCDVHGTKKAE